MGGVLHEKIKDLRNWAPNQVRMFKKQKKPRRVAQINVHGKYLQVFGILIPIKKFLLILLLFFGNDAIFHSIRAQFPHHKRQKETMHGGQIE